MMRRIVGARGSSEPITKSYFFPLYNTGQIIESVVNSYLRKTSTKIIETIALFIH